MQLGILTFLRRSQKASPSPKAPSPTNPEPNVSASARREPAAPARSIVAEAAVEQTPQPFHSERYGYHLTLPPGWRADAPRSIAGSPPIERFSGPDRFQVGVWTESCPLRVLPDVPAAERVGKFSLADGRVVSFAAFAPPADGGMQFLEGRWLAGGKRWTVDVQVPTAGERAPVLEALGGILASLALDD
jgi:hypothetical protein